MPQPAEQSLTSMSRKLAALLKVVSFSPQLVIGHSAGAAIAAQMALDQSIAPRAIISLNGAFVGFGGLAGQLFSPIARLLAAGSFASRFFAWQAQDSAIVDKLVRSTGSVLDAAGMRLYTQLVRNAGHVSGALAMMAHWDLVPLEHALPSLALPVWLVAAENDLTVPPAQAALVARSISNLAFAEGLEGEALCYSYEAYGLAPGALQLGYHLAVLLGLNNYRAAENFATEQIAGQPAFGAAPRVHLVRALARGAVGDLSGALKSIEVAQDLISLDPELGSEVNVVWWLLKRELPESVDDAKDIKLQETLDGIYPEVLRLREKPVYSMLKWPRVFSDMLARVDVSENY